MKPKYWILASCWAGMIGAFICSQMNPSEYVLFSRVFIVFAAIGCPLTISVTSTK